MFSRLWHTLIGKKELRILQWNCNGIRPKTAQLLELLEKEQIDVAVIQETHLNPHHSFSLGTEYIVHRKDRNSHKGGVMTIFRSNLNRVYKMRIETPAGVEGQSWILKAPGLGTLLLHNYYCPPATATARFNLKPVIPYLRQSALLLGDFNSKSPWWGYKNTDPIGRSVQKLVNHHNVVFLNQKGVATLDRGTVPDLSLASADIARHCEWRIGQYHGSDHRTILIKVTNKSREYSGRVVPVKTTKKRRRRLTLKRLWTTLSLYFKKILKLTRFSSKRRKI